MNSPVNQSLSVCFVLFLCLYARALQTTSFTIKNNTPLELRVIWKSFGVGPQARSGEIRVKPHAMCGGCIETYHENCIHTLYVQSLDATYNVKSPQICGDFDIIIGLRQEKNWLGMPVKKIFIDTKNKPNIRNPS